MFAYCVSLSEEVKFIHTKTELNLKVQTVAVKKFQCATLCTELVVTTFVVPDNITTNISEVNANWVTTKTPAAREGFSSPPLGGPRERCSNPQRLEALRQSCRQWDLGSESLPAGIYSKILVDDVHRLLYCAVPKIASTTLKDWFGRNSPLWDGKDRNDFWKVDVLQKHGLKLLYQYPVKEREIRLAEFYKFLVVRHPFDRLVSTHADKFVNPQNTYYSTVFRRIIQNKTGVKVPKEQITFPQFIKLVSENFHNGFQDEHWQSVTSICHPCEIPYDQIIKLEHFNSEIQPVLERFRTGGNNNKYNLTLGNRNNKRPVVDKYSQTNLAYKDIPQDTIRRLYDLYRNDFRLFGYSWDTGSATCSYNSTALGMDCC